MAPTWWPPRPTAVEVVAASGVGIAAALAAPVLAGPLASVLGPIRARDRGGPDPGADPGWFGPGSVAWRVHADPAMFVAGLAAFALQTLHPLALAGVAEHGSFAEDFLGRVQRTGEFVQGVVFGTGGQAEARCARVRRVHRQVVGTAPDGRHYDASDPDLLAWVHLGEYASIAAAYRRFGDRPLTDGDLDAYIDEVARVGVAMGVVRPPRSWTELDRDLQGFRPSLALGEQARLAFRFLADPPGLPRPARPAWCLLWAGARACLPPSALRLADLRSPNPVELVACRALVRALATLLGEPPPLRAARARLAAAGYPAVDQGRAQNHLVGRRPNQLHRPGQSEQSRPSCSAEGS